LRKVLGRAALAGLGDLGPRPAMICRRVSFADGEIDMILENRA